jgi:hypothetical protein
VIEELTKCYVSVYGRTVSIIGEVTEAKLAMEAIDDARVREPAPLGLQHAPAGEDEEEDGPRCSSGRTSLPRPSLSSS